jgi:hypothetical protein
MPSELSDETCCSQCKPDPVRRCSAYEDDGHATKLPVPFCPASWRCAEAFLLPRL